MAKLKLVLRLRPPTPVTGKMPPSLFPSLEEGKPPAAVSCKTPGKKAGTAESSRSAVIESLLQPATGPPRVLLPLVPTTSRHHRRSSSPCPRSPWLLPPRRRDLVPQSPASAPPGPHPSAVELPAEPREAHRHMLPLPVPSSRRKGSPPAASARPPWSPGAAVGREMLKGS
jgi:hypothetical protein